MILIIPHDEAMSTNDVATMCRGIDGGQRLTPTDSGRFAINYEGVRVVLRRVCGRVRTDKLESGELGSAASSLSSRRMQLRGLGRLHWETLLRGGSGVAVTRRLDEDIVLAVGAATAVRSEVFMFMPSLANLVLLWLLGVPASSRNTYVGQLYGKLRLAYFYALP